MTLLKFHRKKGGGGGGGGKRRGWERGEEGVKCRKRKGSRRKPGKGTGWREGGGGGGGGGGVKESNGRIMGGEEGVKWSEVEEVGRVQEKGKGSGGSQRKQPLGKERGGRGEGERRESGGGYP